MSDQQPRPETIALHGGQAPDPTTNARAVPIYQTTSYVFDDTQHAADLFALAVPGNIYTRIMNPTWDVLRAADDRARGRDRRRRPPPPARPRSPTPCSTSRAPATTSSRVVDAVRRHLQPVRAHAAAVRHRGALGRRRTTRTRSRELVDDKTRLVFAETIGNPKLNVVDIAAWADAAHAAGLPLIVDNTVPTPIGTPRLRPRRRHRRALRDEVHRRPRHLDRRRRRRLRASSTGPRNARPVPGPDEARPVLPRRRLGATRSGRPPTSAACARCCCATRARRSRRSTRSCSCRASRRCRCGWSGTRRTPSRSRSTSRRTTASTGSTTRASSRARTTRSRTASSTAATAALVDVRDQGRRARPASVHREPRAVQPPGEHRRREVARDPQRVDDALAAERRGARGRRRDAGHRAPVRRHRAHRRHPRRPRPGARGTQQPSPPDGMTRSGPASGRVETERVVLFTEDDPLVLDSGAHARPGRGRLRDLRRARRRRARTRSSSATR